jgi:hypothetical protein
MLFYTNKGHAASIDSEHSPSSHENSGTYRAIGRKNDRFTFAAAVLAADSARHSISGDHGTRPPTVGSTTARQDIGS